MTDMTMPGDSDSYNSADSFFGTNLTIAVLNGTVPAWRIDDMAMRIMAGFFYVDMDIERDPINFSSWTTDTYGYEHFYTSEGPITQVNYHVDSRGEHGALIRKLGAGSTVLLKNVNNTLPLVAGKDHLTAVFGNDAGPNTAGPNSCSDRGCDNGTLGMAWGSGSTNFPYLVTPDSAIQTAVLTAGGSYESVLDNYANSSITTLARRADVSIVFANSDAGEWYLEVDGNLGQ